MLFGVSAAYARAKKSNFDSFLHCISQSKKRGASAMRHSQFSGKDATKKYGISDTIPIAILENYPVPVGLPPACVVHSDSNRRMGWEKWRPLLVTRRQKGETSSNNQKQVDVEMLFICTTLPICKRRHEALRDELGNKALLFSSVPFGIYI